jgi:hypothetical protein
MVAKAPFGLVAKLSRLADVPIDVLGDCCLNPRPQPKWLRDEAAASQHRAA